MKDEGEAKGKGEKGVKELEGKGEAMAQGEKGEKARTGSSRRNIVWLIWPHLILFDIVWS